MTFLTAPLPLMLIQPWKRRNGLVFSCLNLIPQVCARQSLHSPPWETLSVTVNSRQWSDGTYFSFSSLVSSFWVCSISWRPLMCSSWRSWISAFTACSLENNWSTQQEPKSVTCQCSSHFHTQVDFIPSLVDRESFSFYLFEFFGLYVHLLLQRTIGLLQL